jgi:hypothetical protein
MTTTLEIDQKLYDALVESFGAEALKGKIDDILLSAIENLLEQYTKRILALEEKYGVPFAEFEKMWDEDRVEDKHGREVEGDFMDWEMLEMEKRDMLSALARLRGVRKK